MHLMTTTADQWQDRREHDAYKARALPILLKIAWLAHTVTRDAKEGETRWVPSDACSCPYCELARTLEQLDFGEGERELQ
jgi:hypothetical protein